MRAVGAGSPKEFDLTRADGIPCHIVRSRRDDGFMVGSGPCGASAAVVSRGAELRRIDNLLDAIGTNGRPTVALVSGAAGVGKSRLVQETVARAAARGTRTSVGRCVEFGAMARRLGRRR